MANEVCIAFLLLKLKTQHVYEMNDLKAIYSLTFEDFPCDLLLPAKGNKYFWNQSVWLPRNPVWLTSLALLWSLKMWF